jgi:hypothetical protein
MTREVENDASMPMPGRSRQAWPAWTPLLVLPAAALAFRALLLPWQLMWTLAIAIFLGCKWQSWWECRERRGATIGRSVGYLFAWPGMDAAAFLDPETVAPRPEWKEWIWACAKTAAGAALLWGVVPRVPSARPLLAGWVGMVAIILILHFGTFHILSLVWRGAGVDARSIMQAPLSATALSDFWGRRWNLGFRQLTHRLIFTPARARVGAPAALTLSFLASGLIHDLVISLPARGGYGSPTGYFVVQGLGVLLERSPAGEKLSLRAGFKGWLFAVVCAGSPAFLLFHPWFVTRVILPFLAAVGAR